MTDLSPQAQAVLDEYSAAADFTFHPSLDFWGVKAGLAAALRAAADQVGQTPADLGNPEWKDGVLLAYRHLLAIAAELEGHG